MKPLVLCVEDDEDIQFLLQMSIEKLAQCDAVIMPNGLEALRLLESVQPDMIIIDWMMPEMSGLELLINLKKNQFCKDVVKLILTAKSGVSHALRLNDLSVDKVINKPFDPYEIASLVKYYVY